MDGRFFLTKEITFEASHRLVGLPEGHKCLRQHGHSWRAKICVSGPDLDPETGMLVDFGVMGQVRDLLDHQDLNEVLRPRIPTSEEVARFVALHVASALPESVRVDSVEVFETCTSSCLYSIWEDEG